MSQEQLTEEQQADLVLWKAAVIQSPGGPETRETAVKRLYESGWPEAYVFLDECLRSPVQTEIIEVVCGAIRHNGIPPYQLRDSLLDALESADVATIPILVETLASYPVGDVLPRLVELIGQSERPVDQQVAIVHSMSQFVEVEAVDALIERLNTDEREPIRLAVLEALEAITGETGNGDITVVWNLWWQQNRSRGREWLLENALQRQKVRASELRRHSESLDQELTGLLNELITAHERVYWLTGVDDRPALLQQYLSPDTRIEIRLLGFRLVEKTISNAEPIQPGIVDVVVDQVGDSNRLIRLAAYRLLGLLDGDRAVGMAMGAFDQEGDSEVRRVMITLMEQHPSAAVVLLLVPSLDVPSEQNLAVTAMVSACRKSAVDTAAVDEAVRHVLVDRDIKESASFNPNEIELFAWSTNESAQGIVRGVLEDEWAESTIVEAAARGLAQSGYGLDVLLSASARIEVYPWVVELLAQREGIESLRSVLDQSAPNDDFRRQAVIGIMKSLPPSDWLAADDLVFEAGVVLLTDRIEHLSGVFEINGETNGGSHPVEPLDGLVRRALCLRLAELDLLNHLPAAALMALEAAPAAEVDQDRFNRLRAIAHLALGHLNQPDMIDHAGVAEWIEAIGISLDMEPADLSIARRLVEGVRQRFGDPLADAKQEETLLALVQQIDERLGDDSEPDSESTVDEVKDTPSAEVTVDENTEVDESGESGGGESKPETDSPDKSEDDK